MHIQGSNYTAALDDDPFSSVHYDLECTPYTQAKAEAHTRIIFLLLIGTQGIQEQCYTDVTLTFIFNHSR